MKKISQEQLLQNIEQNISNFEQVLKQKILSFNFEVELVQIIRFLRRERTRIKREIRAKEKKAGKEAPNERNA